MKRLVLTSLLVGVGVGLISCGGGGGSSGGNSTGIAHQDLELGVSLTPPTKAIEVLNLGISYTMPQDPFAYTIALYNQNSSTNSSNLQVVAASGSICFDGGPSQTVCTSIPVPLLSIGQTYSNTIYTNIEKFTPFALSVNPYQGVPFTSLTNVTLSMPPNSGLSNISSSTLASYGLTIIPLNNYIIPGTLSVSGFASYTLISSTTNITASNTTVSSAQYSYTNIPYVCEDSGSGYFNLSAISAVPMSCNGSITYSSAVYAFISNFSVLPSYSYNFSYSLGGGSSTTIINNQLVYPTPSSTINITYQTYSQNPNAFSSSSNVLIAYVNPSVIFMNGYTLLSSYTPIGVYVVNTYGETGFINCNSNGVSCSVGSGFIRVVLPNSYTSATLQYEQTEIMSFGSGSSVIYSGAPYINMPVNIGVSLTFNDGEVLSASNSATLLISQN